MIATPQPIYPYSRHSMHCTGSWVELGSGLDRCWRSCPHQDLNTGSSSPQKPLYCLYYLQSLIDDRLKYNISSLTVLLGNMTAPCECWRWQLTVPVVTCYLTVQCHNTPYHSLKQTVCLFHCGGFHQWTEDVCARESVFVINWDQLNCHEHQNAF